MKKIIIVTVAFSIIHILSSAGYTAPVQWNGNGHYYDLITGALNWYEAKAAAESQIFNELTGYLATITSASENEFINATFYNGQAGQFAWLGGWEPNDDGVWKWAVGPETGTQFSNYGTPTAPYNYVNWGGIEPNDKHETEEYAMYNIGLIWSGLINPGEWADGELAPSDRSPAVGYLVEYSVVPEPISSILFATGGTLLAGRRYMKRRKA